MRWITILLCTTLSSSALYVNITDQRERDALPSGAVILDGQVYPDGSAQIAQWASQGWRVAEGRPVAPEGYVLVSYTWADDDGIHATSNVVLRTQAEQDAIDTQAAADAAAALEAWKDAQAISQQEYAFAQVALSEINLLRSWIAAFKVETAAATSLLNLQSRVAALPAMPERTEEQMVTAIRSKL